MLASTKYNVISNNKQDQNNDINKNNNNNINKKNNKINNNNKISLKKCQLNFIDHN